MRSNSSGVEAKKGVLARGHLGRHLRAVRSAFMTRVRVLSMLRLGHPGTVSALVVASILQALSTAMTALATGLAISRLGAAAGPGLASSAGRSVLDAVAVLGVVLVVERLSTFAGALLRTRVAQQVDGAIRDRVFASLRRAPTLDVVEDPSFQNHLKVLDGGFFGTPGEAVTATLNVVGRYVQAVSCALIIAWFSIWLALCRLVVILVVRRRWHVGFAELAISQAVVSGGLRRSAYFGDLVLEPNAAKEIRIYQLLDWLVDRQRTFWHDAVAPAFAVRRKLRRRSAVELVGLLATALLTCVIASWAAARGDIGLGMFSAIMLAQVGMAMLTIPNRDDYVSGTALAARDALRAIDAATDTTRSGSRDRPARLRPTAPDGDICFDDVTFAYPGSDRPVLDAFRLTVRAGESLGIVGANGAGKTTIIKLLCGLYVPARGRITVGGVDLGLVDVESWRRQVSVVFQDFTRYEISAQDNIALAGWAIDGERPGPAVGDPGLDSLVTALPRGWDTPLSRQYDGGVDLSAGQWQRVALARARHRHRLGASVLVLDEPTANLDIRAETELFEELLATTAGATTILISHRFASVRHCDRIVVIDAGRVVEEGDHDGLVAACGRYAELFRLQAERFGDDLHAEVVVS
jgi:ATP-binding cassette, subfamily B, bacterial